MNAALAIRDARADDLARIVAIYNEAVAEGNVQAALFWGMACFQLDRFIDAP